MGSIRGGGLLLQCGEVRVEALGVGQALRAVAASRVREGDRSHPVGDLQEPLCGLCELPDAGGEGTAYLATVRVSLG